MPETIKSLKIENDSLKSQIISLEKDFKSFQEAMEKKLTKLLHVCNDKTINLRIAKQKKALTPSETMLTI